MCVNTGRIGIDIGTSTIAVTHPDGVMLQELGKDTSDYAKQINRIQRAMDRSRRAMNPNNFNEDGTIKRGKKLHWVYSHNYKKLAAKKKSLERKQTASLKCSHGKLANEILSHDNEVFVEDMNFKGLQKRARETTYNKKGRANRKGRFGKSLKNHAPATLINIIDRKLHYEGSEIHKVNTKAFRASQYNHVTDDYVKKKLSMRHAWVEDRCVQRDPSLSFLLQNSSKSLDHADRELCNDNFDRFLEQHNNLIIQMQSDGNSYPSSFGLRHIRIAV
jgi:hypothetical protein